MDPKKIIMRLQTIWLLPTSSVRDFLLLSVDKSISMKYADCFTILGISIATAFLCEGISWVIIYRTENYKNLLSSINRTSKKLEVLKGKPAPVSKSKSTKNKKVDLLESNLKQANQRASATKLQSGFVVGLTMLLVFGMLSTIFEGRVVAKLPFSPYLFIQKMSHRGLPGDDPTDCALVFFYMLCSMSIRPNLQKLLGFAPPRASAPANPFALPVEKTK